MRRKVLVALACVFAGAQAIRFEHTNPPATGELAAPPSVQRVLRNGCYDCHSNETAWPWSANLAPISWLVHYDVTEGRRRLNFSNWDAYASDPETQIQKLKNIQKAMAADDMPPWYYRLLHPDSRLSESQRKAVVRWVAEQITGTPSSQ
ncbi:MAG TPA: heme-binding domain-containing protein [Myxococcota bacterium]|nr:heme-binding domain-containing protein [Myxococcota bacterium]